MSLLASCCAGPLAAGTDRGDACTGLANLLTAKVADDNRNEDARESLVAVTLDVIDLSKAPLSKLVGFRERERSEAKGYQYRDLRHRFRDRLENRLRNCKSANTGGTGGPAERLSRRYGGRPQEPTRWTA